MPKRLFLFLILIFALFLRVYKIDKVPPSLDWDEAAVGYNAYSILKTGRDEFGQIFPLAFRSFDDYKAPLYVYMLVPGIAFFGLNEWSVRLPSAILGTLTVILVYFLVKELFHKPHKSYNEDFLPLISSLLFAISPWHLQFSRVGFEPNIALFFTLAGTLFFLKAVKSPKFYFFSFIFYLLSLYSYHSARIFVPLLISGLLCIYKKQVIKEKKHFLAFFFLFLIFSLPLIFITFKPAGQSRMKAAAIFNQQKAEAEIGLWRQEHDNLVSLPAVLFHNKFTFYFQEILRNYLSHFSPDFLFSGTYINARLNLKNQGQLYWIELPFLLYGLSLFIKEKQKWQKLILYWLLIAPLPAAIATEAPHSLRTLMILPTYQIIIAYGIVNFLRKFKSFVYLFICLFAYLFIFIVYLHNYYIHYPLYSSFDWQYGHKEMAFFVKSQEHKYNKIIITDRYLQPYIFYLFYNKINPQVYQKQGLPKFEFREIKWKEDKNLENTLLIASPEEIPENISVDKVINFLDGKPAFKILKNSL